MKHHQKHYRTAAGFVTLSGLILGLVLAGQYETPEAIAGDDKIFASQFCVPIDDPANDDHTIDEDDTEFRNNRVTTPTGDQKLICPLIRDSIGEALNKVFVNIRNVAKSSVTDPNTRCCVHSFAADGESEESECDEANEGQTSRQLLEIEGPDLTDTGYFVLICHLEDPNESLFRIRTSEDS